MQNCPRNYRVHRGPRCAEHPAWFSDSPAGGTVTGASEKVCPLLGKVGICPGLTSPGQRHPSWKIRFLQPYCGHGRDTEDTVPGVRRAAPHKVLLPAWPVWRFLCVSWETLAVTRGRDQGPQAESSFPTRTGRGDPMGPCEPRAPGPLTCLMSRCTMGAGLFSHPCDEETQPRKVLENTHPYPPSIPPPLLMEPEVAPSGRPSFQRGEECKQHRNFILTL